MNKLDIYVALIPIAAAFREERPFGAAILLGQLMQRLDPEVRAEREAEQEKAPARG